MGGKIFQYVMLYLATMMFAITMIEWIRQPWDQILDLSFFLDVAICVFFVDVAGRHLRRKITININLQKDM